MWPSDGAAAPVPNSSRRKGRRAAAWRVILMACARSQAGSTGGTGPTAFNPGRGDSSSARLPTRGTVSGRVAMAILPQHLTAAAAIGWGGRRTRGARDGAAGWASGTDALAAYNSSGPSHAPDDASGAAHDARRDPPHAAQSSDARYAAHNAAWHAHATTAGVRHSNPSAAHHTVTPARMPHAAPDAAVEPLLHVTMVAQGVRPVPRIAEHVSGLPRQGPHGRSSRNGPA